MAYRRGDIAVVEYSGVVAEEGICHGVTLFKDNMLCRHVYIEEEA